MEWRYLEGLKKIDTYCSHIPTFHYEDGLEYSYSRNRELDPLNCGVATATMRPFLFLTFAVDTLRCSLSSRKDRSGS